MTEVVRSSIISRDRLENFQSLGHTNLYPRSAYNKNFKMGKKDESGGQDSEASVYRIPPYHYLHVLDKTTNVTRVEVGPKTFIRQENEKVILEPTKMIIVPPRHFCVIKNPAKKDEQGEPIKDAFEQVGKLVCYKRSYLFSVER